MKRILYVINDTKRNFTYARISGLCEAIARQEEPMSLYVFRSEGYSGFASAHNRGEYNIYRLPDYRDFDGILLDTNSIYSGKLNPFGSAGAQYAVQAAVASGKPVISLANQTDDCYYVGIDNAEAMRSVIEYLHGEQNLTDFWFIMGPPDNYENIIRLNALKSYCGEKGLSCGEDRLYMESYDARCGTNGFRELYRKRSRKLPQAIICANDHIARGVCEAAEEEGIRIPGDVMVTGLDNHDVSTYLSPSITTVDQLCEHMGEEYLNQLCRIWQGENPPRIRYTPTRLIPRESTGGVNSRENGVPERIRDYIRRDIQSTNFNFALTTMQYELPGCESIGEMCESLTKCVSFLGSSGLYLVLDRELYENHEEIVSDRDDTRIREAGSGLMTEGYPKEMELVYSWEEGKEPVCPRRMIRGIFPAFDAVEGRENFLFLPLHFMEHSAGYLVIRNGLEMLRQNCIPTIVNTLTMAMRSFFARNQLKSINRMLSGVSMRDSLTGLYNRMGYSYYAPRLFRREKEAGRRAAVLFVDMDDMKYFNDTYGHACGDKAIMTITEAVSESLPADGIAVRYGGDEFLLVFPAEGKETAERLLKSIRGRIAAKARKHGLPASPRFSAGFVLTDPKSERTLNDYVEEADRRMYADKDSRKTGRSRMEQHA